MEMEDDRDAADAVRKLDGERAVITSQEPRLRRGIACAET
jgi:hypothetical protein